MHHIVSDGWSLPIFVRELWAFHAAYCGAVGTAGAVGATGRGAAGALPELPIQYADFAAWQRRWLQGPVLAAELAHWRQRLAGLPPRLDLPLDRPRPAVRTWRGALLGADLGPDVSQALLAAARRLAVTPFMVVVSALGALLRRNGGQDTLALGVPVAGRNRLEIEPLIGFFVNTLVLRCELSDGLALGDLVRQVRDTVLDADAHQDLPFEKLVEELAPERSRGHSPLFQVMLAFQNLPPQPPAGPGLNVTPIAATTGTAKFDLTFSVQTDGARGMTVWVEYATEVFDGATVRRLLDGYAQLLAGLAAAPAERTVAALHLLSAAQRHQLLVEWNPSRAAEPGDGKATLHQLFAAQADRTPDLPALTAGGETLTYRQLDERASRLAHHLIAAGVAPGNLVGLCFERSADLVTALLAVLAAGAGYLPLDPSHPAERLAFTLADSGVALVLGTTATLANLPHRDSTPATIAVDAGAAAEAIAARSPRRPDVSTGPEVPAYVIYTSGSTGRPKGVVVTHGQASRLFHSTAAWFGSGPDDVWTLFHSYAFDFSVWEIWGALLFGGRLVVVPSWESKSPEAFLALLRDERVTVLNQTPSAFRQLLWAVENAPDAAADLPALRLVIFGGEALDPASLAPWFRRNGDERPRLVNMYGITETTVHVTYRPIGWDDVAAARSVLGVPLPDLTVHVVGRDLEPQPVGVPGEIAVGGAGVALGYLGQPGLTAQRFVPDPYAAAAGSRLYRSGDLARRLPSGDVEYLGRIDSQVKMRGFRIELGEIAAALERHPAVAQAIVGLRATAGADRDETQLVAWYVPVPAALGGVADPGELRAALRRELPEPMIPAWFVALPALPLTANGKVDRGVLPAPEASLESGAAAAGRTSAAPDGPVEERNAAIWREVLGRPFVGAHDNFFELGGHSLLATQALSRMRAAFDIDLPLRALFDSPTVAGTAAAIVQMELEQADDDLLASLLSQLEDGPAAS
jgi:amino acid adenylation domain-containing protein